MEKLIGIIGAAKKVLIPKKTLNTKDWSKKFNLTIYAMNVVDVYLAYKGITRTAKIKPDFYN